MRQTDHATVPPTPAQAMARRQLESEAANQHSLHRWWAPPALITGLLAAPISLAMAAAIGLRGAVAVVGSVFVVLGSVVVVAKTVSIVRAGVAVRAVELLRALIVLGPIAGVTYALWSVLTF
ncbi:hypothetical protein [Pseudonocardia hierapolitana]|nr:hypothetical protein [Pseudonocardia hierapolitana]